MFLQALPIRSAIAVAHGALARPFPVRFCRHCPFARLSPFLMARWRAPSSCVSAGTAHSLGCRRCSCRAGAPFSRAFLQALPIRSAVADAHVALARYKNRKACFLSLKQAWLGESGLFYFCSACRNAQSERTDPRAPMSPKSVLQVRDQGLEPRTP